MSRTVLTYGTFDLFHAGHLRLLKRLAALGDRLVVGVSTDEFNQLKGKSSIFSYEQRADIVANLKMVSEVFPECHWNQKRADILRYRADVFGMGSDWDGKFDELRDICEVVYLPRTEGISSTKIKNVLRAVDNQHLRDFAKATDLMSNIASQLE